MRSEPEIKERLALLLETFHNDQHKNLLLVTAMRELEWVLGARLEAVDKTFGNQLSHESRT